MVDKQNKPNQYDIFEHAWRAMIQRFENTISHHNFPGPQNPQDSGLLIVDRTDEPKLRKLMRKMRVYNPISSRFGSSSYRHMPLKLMVEDPIHRNSLHSYFIQLSDVNAYFLYQKHITSGYIKRKGGRNYFNRLGPILCIVASSNNDEGIVWL